MTQMKMKTKFMAVVIGIAALVVLFVFVEGMHTVATMGVIKRTTRELPFMSAGSVAVTGWRSFAVKNIAFDEWIPVAFSCDGIVLRELLPLQGKGRGTHINGHINKGRIALNLGDAGLQDASAWFDITQSDVMVNFTGKMVHVSIPKLSVAGVGEMTLDYLRDGDVVTAAVDITFDPAFLKERADDLLYVIGGGQQAGSSISLRASGTVPLIDIECSSSAMKLSFSYDMNKKSTRMEG